MALPGVITAFKTGPGTYTVTRNTAAGYDTNGRVIAPVTSTLEIVACIQPTAGRELDMVPEGYVGNETKTVWTETELIAISPSNRSDSVSISSEDWFVIAVKDWEAFGSEFYVAIISRVLVTA